MKRTMPLSELLPDVALPRDVVIGGLVMDSRRIEPGDAFVAIAGFGTHGLAFVEQAKEKQASAILFDASAPSAEYSAPADVIGEVADGLERVGRVEIVDELVVVAGLWRLRGHRTGKDAERSDGGCRSRHA